MNEGEEEPIYIIGGEARRKELTRKVKLLVWIISGWILERWDGVV
jgi:hypothetical protein